MINVHEHAWTKRKHTCASVQGSKVEVPWTTFLWKSLGAEVDGLGGGTKRRILYLHSCGVWGQSLKMKGRLVSRVNSARLLDQCLPMTPLWSCDHQLCTFTSLFSLGDLFIYLSNKFASIVISFDVVYLLDRIMFTGVAQQSLFPPSGLEHNKQEWSQRKKIKLSDF